MENVESAPELVAAGDAVSAARMLKASEVTPKEPTPESSSEEANASPVDYELVAADLKAIMDDPEWDDGSLAPVLIRLAWHSSGTYDAQGKTGGSNNCGLGGATMRFGAEKADPENAGLDLAQAKLEGVKQKHGAGLSYADLWILAAYVAIEHTGGPKMEFKPGRVDAADGSKCPHGDGAHNPNKSRLPPADLGSTENAPTGCPMHKKEQRTIDAVRATFARMGIGDREVVALLCGGHVYGRCHRERTGYAGPWVEEMTIFSNEYAADMVGDKWVEVTHESPDCPHDEVRPAPGKRQYVSLGPGDEDEGGGGEVGDGSGSEGGGAPKQMMLISDMALLWDPEWRLWLEYYADEKEGQARLSEDFGLAFKRLTELGFDTSADAKCPFAAGGAPPPADAAPAPEEPPLEEAAKL